MLFIKENLKVKAYKNYLLKDEILFKIIDRHVIILLKQMLTEAIKKFHDDVEKPQTDILLTEFKTKD